MRLSGFIAATAAVGTSAVQLYTNDVIRDGVSDQCRDALTSDVACDGADQITLQNPTADSLTQLFAQLGQILPSLCSNSCNDAMNGWVNGIRNSCSLSDENAITLLPFSALELGGIHLMTYNIMCSQDENDQFCIADPAFIATEALEIGEDGSVVSCSFCQTQFLAHMLSLDFAPRNSDMVALFEQCAEANPAATEGVTSIVVGQPTETGSNDDDDDDDDDDSNNGGASGAEGNNNNSGAMKLSAMYGGVVSAALLVGTLII